MANNPMDFVLQMLMQGNPNQVMQNMVQQNPQFNAILNQAKQSGMSMKDFTLNYAKQNGIDIQPMLNMLSQRGFRF